VVQSIRAPLICVSGMFPSNIYTIVLLWICLHACDKHGLIAGDEKVVYRQGNHQEGVHGEAQAGVCKKVFKEKEGVYTNVLWAEQPACRQGRNDTGKLLVVAPHINAHLIRLQKQSLDLFLQEPYEYIVYDDAYSQAHFSNWNTAGISAHIKKAAEEVGGTYRRVPQGFHDDRRCLFPATVEPFVNNANTRCSDAYQFILRDEDVYCSSGIVLFMDADVFLISPFAPTTMLRSSNLQIASVPLHKKYSTVGFSLNVTQLWTAINVMDMRAMPGKQDLNWDCGSLWLFEGTPFAKRFAIDSGGHTMDWLGTHNPRVLWWDIVMVAASTEEDWKWFAHKWADIFKIHGLRDLEFKSQILGDTFLHLRNAGNWMLSGEGHRNIQPEQHALIAEFMKKRKEEFDGGDIPYYPAGVPSPRRRLRASQNPPVHATRQ